MFAKHHNSHNDTTQRLEIGKMLDEDFKKHMHKMVNHHNRYEQKIYLVKAV